MRERFEKPIFATKNTVEDYKTWRLERLFSKWVSIRIISFASEPHPNDTKELMKIGEAINIRYLPEKLETYKEIKNYVHKEMFLKSFLAH